MPRNVHRVTDDRSPEPIRGTSADDIDDADDAPDDEDSLAFELAVWKAFRRLVDPDDPDDCELRDSPPKCGLHFRLPRP